MYFQPRIFISSLLKGKLGIREEIKNELESCGATVLLYEKDLTPSITPYTYRKDILDADFVIVILDEAYGAKTPSGKSGTEEEYNLATENKLNTHVYIKRAADSEIAEAQKEFLDKIKKSGVSYYEYENDSDLITRIKESIMAIAKGIAINTLSNKDLDAKDLIKISFAHDYEIAIGIAAIYERFNNVIDNDSIDFIYSDVVSAFFDSLYYWVENNPHLFLDSRFYDLCLAALKFTDEFNKKHSQDFVLSNSGISFKRMVPKIGEVEIWRCNNYSETGVDRDWYIKKMEQVKDAFERFTSYIRKQKYSIDIYLET